MNATSTVSDAGYSPPITIELILHGQRYNVSSLGPGRLSLRNPSPAAPGRGTVEVVVDGRPTIFHVDLSKGIDPGEQEQMFQMVRLVDGAAA